MLTKNDFQRVLNDYQRQKTDAMIAKIRQFDIFKTFTRRRLNDIYRLFFN